MFFQNATADFITNCDGLLLQSAIGITKCDRTTLQSGRVTKIWLHTCGDGKDVHRAVEFSCTLITKGTERSNTYTKTLLLFFYRCVDCSTVKDHSYFIEIYLFVSPCFHSDIFLTSSLFQAPR